MCSLAPVVCNLAPVVCSLAPVVGSLAPVVGSLALAPGIPLAGHRGTPARCLDYIFTNFVQETLKSAHKCVKP